MLVPPLLVIMQVSRPVPVGGQQIACLLSACSVECMCWCIAIVNYIYILFISQRDAGSPCKLAVVHREWHVLSSQLLDSIDVEIHLKGGSFRILNLFRLDCFMLLDFHRNNLSLWGVFGEHPYFLFILLFFFSNDTVLIQKRHLSLFEDGDRMGRIVVIVGLIVVKLLIEIKFHKYYMGSALQKQKDIEKEIDKQFKAVRRYCDEVYGEITVMQHRLSKYALIQKIVDDIDSFQSLLSSNNNQKSYLVGIQKHYSCKLDMCATNRKYYLLVDYEDHSLQKEIIKRQETLNYFKITELKNILAQFARIAEAFKDSRKFMISNKLILLNFNRLQLRVLQPELTNKFQNSNGLKFYRMEMSEQPSRSNLLLAPEVMNYLWARKNTQAYDCNLRQSARVYTLGLCFFEIAMLVDASSFYTFEETDGDRFRIDSEKIGDFVKIVRNIYGQDVYQLISSMLRVNPNDRISMTELNQSLKGNLQKSLKTPKNSSQTYLKASEQRARTASINYYRAKQQQL